jgi:hypothetical protein
MPLIKDWGVVVNELLIVISLSLATSHKLERKSNTRYAIDLVPATFLQLLSFMGDIADFILLS